MIDFSGERSISGAMFAHRLPLPKTERPTGRTWTRLSLVVGLLSACGGTQETALPDESSDLTVGSAGGSMPRDTSYLEGTRPVSREIGGTQWSWVEAHCTEGPLDLSGRGFESKLRVAADDGGLWLTYDHAFTAPVACGQTVVQRARIGEGGDWTMLEATNIAVPTDCGAEREADRPGDMRMRGAFLEVYVQRSNWCGGFEVRHVYAPAERSALSTAELVRHYAAHFDRGDAGSLSRLFSDVGSLVEPFTISDTGSTRHEGREAVQIWYSDAFSDLPWQAFRLTSLSVEGDQASADWEYIDPRLEVPMQGSSTFTVAAGEIYETTMRASDTAE